MRSQVRMAAKHLDPNAKAQLWERRRMSSFEKSANSYHRNAVLAANSPHWYTMVVTSFHAKKPIVEFLYWGQKLKGRHHRLTKAALAVGHAYLGKTPLCEFVAWKAESVALNISRLLDDDAVKDPLRWGQVWTHCTDEGERPKALSLIIPCVLKAVGGWDNRAMSVVTSFPALILLIVEKQAHLQDEKRASVASLLLDTSDCCLQDRYSDFTVKFKKHWISELGVVKETGKCPVNLFAFVLGQRSQQGLDTQEVEGYISVLQCMANRGHNIHLPSASSRMSLKFGEQLTADDCVGLDSAVVQELNSDNNAARFMPICEHSRAPAALQFKQCMHQYRKYNLSCLGYALSVAHDLELGASLVHWFLLDGYAINPGTTLAYVFGWSLRSHLLGARCQLLEVDGTLKTVRDSPLVLVSLVDAISQLFVGLDDEERKHRVLFWQACPVAWSWPNFRTGTLHLDDLRRTRVRKRSVRRPSARHDVTYVPTDAEPLMDEDAAAYV